MNRIRWLVVLLVLTGILVLMLQSGSNRAVSSVVSRGADGWYGFRQALDLRKIPVELKKEPWHQVLADDSDGVAGDTVWLMVFPWQRSLGSEELQKMSHFLRDGGTLWVGYSGSSSSQVEATVLESLGMGPLRRIRESTPLSPVAWWRYRTERWELEPSPNLGLDSPKVEIPALEYAPGKPRRAKVYYRGGSVPARDREQADVQIEERTKEQTEVQAGHESLSTGQAAETADTSVPLIFSYERLGGKIIVVPAALWSNAEILSADHLALLDEFLKQVESRPRWWVDEYHHGLLDQDLVRQSAANASWDYFFLHLMVIYCLGVWALARRFGPVWHERPVRFGSTAEFLENLGGLHHRLGHHRDAARQLAGRMTDLYPQQASPSETQVQLEAQQVSDGPSLVRFAQQLSRRAQGTRNSSSR